MSAPTLTLPVIAISDYGRRLEARAGDEETILGTAERSHGQDMDWIGWLIVVDGRHTEVRTKVEARRVLLAQVAELLAGGGPR